MLKHSKESDETKRKILQAAKKEFADKGFNGARMSSIASLAGVNQALLHYHFESKENLYRSIFQSSLGDIPDTFSKIVTEEIDSWKTTVDVEVCAAIYLIVGIHFDTHDEDLHRLFAREMAEGKGMIHEFVKNYILPRILLFENILKDGVKQGIFEISNTLMLSICIAAFVGDFAHGEEFMKGTRIYDELYTDKKERLYNFMLELTFKALRPAGKELKIPVLDNDKKQNLDQIIRDMSEYIMHM